MSKYIRNIILLIVLAVLSIIILYQYSTREKHLKNGFSRRYYSGDAVQIGTQFLNGSYSIGLIKADSVWLYAIDQPFTLLKYPISLKSNQQITLPFPTDEKKIRGVNSVLFDGNNTFLLNGRTSMLYQSSASRLVGKHKIDNISFSHSDIISPKSFVVASRRREDSNMRRIIKKLDANGNLLGTFTPEKQIDGYLCTDGQLKYDRKSHRLVYMYFYRGILVCLDSNLRVKYVTKTIDTITRASLRLQRKETSINGSTVERITTTKPPVMVNRRLCVDGDKIYVLSALKADNENSAEFHKSQVIDVYHIKNGKYHASFYLPKINHQKISDFKIYGNTVATIYKNNLVTFKIPDK